MTTDEMRAAIDARLDQLDALSVAFIAAGGCACEGGSAPCVSPNDYQDTKIFVELVDDHDAIEFDDIELDDDDIERLYESLSISRRN
jgi:hypothetical protein